MYRIKAYEFADGKLKANEDVSHLEEFSTRSAARAAARVMAQNSASCYDGTSIFSAESGYGVEQGGVMIYRYDICGMSKKLTMVEGTVGLQAYYGGGDYTVTVWSDEDHAYEMIFCRSNTDIPHERERVTAEQLEARMREIQPDLRKWRKAMFNED